MDDALLMGMLNGLTDGDEQFDPFSERSIVASHGTG